MEENRFNRIKGYIESEFKSKVKSIELVDCLMFAGAMDGVFSVKVVDAEEPEWWVFYGSGVRPMHFYSKKRYPSADEAFSFHLGLMARVMEREEEPRFCCNCGEPLE